MVNFYGEDNVHGLDGPSSMEQALVTFSRDSTHSAVIDKSVLSPTLVQVTATVDQREEVRDKVCSG